MYESLVDFYGFELSSGQIFFIGSFVFFLQSVMLFSLIIGVIKLFKK